MQASRLYLERYQTQNQRWQPIHLQLAILMSVWWNSTIIFRSLVSSSSSSLWLSRNSVELLSSLNKCSFIFHSLAVADIPGLIEGAHMNKGLGHSFLRHIERCRCLLYVIDISLDNPISHLNMLKTELDLYKPGLSSLPAAIVANKIDILGDLSKRDYVGTQFTGIPLPFVAVSGKLGTNIADLKVFIRKLYEQNVN